MPVLCHCYCSCHCWVQAGARTVPLALASGGANASASAGAGAGAVEGARACATAAAATPASSFVSVFVPGESSLRQLEADVCRAQDRNPVASSTPRSFSMSSSFKPPLPY